MFELHNGYLILIVIMDLYFFGKPIDEKVLRALMKWLKWSMIFTSSFFYLFGTLYLSTYIVLHIWYTLC